jgi:glutathione synthase
MKAFRFLWITDPWKTLDHAKDTTLRLAQESLKLGHRSFWADVKTIRLEGGKVFLDVQEVLSLPSPINPKTLRLSPARKKSPGDFDSIHYRTDPPVDLAYLHPLQILALENPPVVNPLEVLFRANEKFEAIRTPGLMPPTLVSGEWESLKAFGLKHRRTVLKPIHLAQSKGIELLDWKGDQKKNKRLISKLTDHFQRPVLLQRYLAGIEKGEQRIWFLDGKILAVARKLPPKKGDFKIDMDQGSRVVSSTLTEPEHAVAIKIGHLLAKNRIRLAAVDLIEAKVTDFNFTSPGLISQMEAATGQNLAKIIIGRLASRTSS